MYRLAMQKRSTSINVVARAAQVLKACQELGGNLSLGDIARHLSLPRSTVQRIVQTLVQEGLLASGGSARSITLGPQLLSIGAIAATNVVERIQPLLRNLAAKTGETVDLSRLNGDHMVFVNQMTGSQRLRTVSAVGDTFPLHCTANGKAVLAELPEDQLNNFLVRPLRKHTPHTITNVQQLRQQLVNVRKEGLSVDAEEHSIGICAVGIAIRDKAHQFYAVSIPVPSIRFAQCRARCERALSEEKDNLQRVLMR
jgi:DNA-binding IclR family transcriptional regulator